MADPLTPVERFISGKGVVKIPDAYRKAKRITLFTQVLRTVRTPSVNLTFNPDKSFYAHITFCKDKFVLQTYDVNFAEQMFAVWDNQAGQNLLALKCGVQQLLVDAQSLISEFEYNTFIADTLLFECFATTSLLLTLRGEAMQVCDEEDNTPAPTPPIPPPVSPVPPDEPIFVSAPYPDDPAGEDTAPVPQDEFSPLPVGCLQTALTYRVISVQFPAPGLTATMPFEGEAASISSQPGAGPNQFDVNIIGSRTINGQCVGGQLYPIFQNLEQPYEIEILSILPI